MPYSELDRLGSGEYWTCYSIPFNAQWCLCVRWTMFTQWTSRCDGLQSLDCILPRSSSTYYKRWLWLLWPVWTSLTKPFRKPFKKNLLFRTSDAVRWSALPPKGWINFLITLLLDILESGVWDSLQSLYDDLRLTIGTFINWVGLQIFWKIPSWDSQPKTSNSLKFNFWQFLVPFLVRFVKQIQLFSAYNGWIEAILLQLLSIRLSLQIETLNAWKLQWFFTIFLDDNRNRLSDYC